MHAPVQLIRSASLNGYAELARSLGIEPRRALRRVDLPLRCLEDPELLISAHAVAQLLEDAAQESGEENIGLRMAVGRRLSNLGPISIVLREEPTGRQALNTLCRYLLVLNASLITRLEAQRDVVVIREELMQSDDRSVRQAMELAVGVMHRILAELLGPAWRPRWVSFTHSAPRDLRHHRALFGAKVEFGADFNGIVCAARDLDERLPTVETGMAPYARRFLDEALTSALPNARDAARRLILVMLPSGRCTAELVATHLGIDRRTLHRHLRAQGINFNGLLQSIREELVQRRIRESGRSLTELAELLGFSSPSAFAYWFRSRFGCTVSQWRAGQGLHGRDG